jgi:hypothetical protein|tara:strand:- start:4875 stop:5174 length:300 start_codon:yes stop_codon:yes gene_type:complete
LIFLSLDEDGRARDDVEATRARAVDRRVGLDRRRRRCGRARERGARERDRGDVEFGTRRRRRRRATVAKRARTADRSREVRVDGSGVGETTIGIAVWVL